MSTQTPIVTSKIDGYLVVAGPAAEMESAERVTIESGRFAGETVRLGCRQVWGTGGVTVERIARRLTHPEHGEIVYAYVDVRNGLDDAPMLAAAWAPLRRSVRSTTPRAWTPPPRPRKTACPATDHTAPREGDLPI